MGLDIGSSAVKAVELKPAGKGYRVAAFAVEPVPPDAIVDGAIIDAGAPTNPIPAQTVNFNGVASTGAGGSTISAWSWNFGDGSTDESEEPTTSHAYTLAGAYIVRLTVTDSSGRTGTTTQTLTVAAAD